MPSEPTYHLTRRDVVVGVSGAIATSALPSAAQAQTPASGPMPGDRVIPSNEDFEHLEHHRPGEGRGDLKHQPHQFRRG